MQLWTDIARGADDENRVIDWFLRIFSQIKPLKYYEEHPDMAYFSCDTLDAVYVMLKVRENSGIGLQQFIDLVQQTGEEFGLLSLANENMDEVYPVEALRAFAKMFIRGFARMMRGLNFEPWRRRRRS